MRLILGLLLILAMYKHPLVHVHVHIKTLLRFSEMISKRWFS